MSTRCGSIIKLFLVILSVFVYGCLFPGMWKDPGYKVTINVQQFSKKDIGTIEQILIDKNYSLISRSNDDERYIIQFSKTVVKDTQIKEPNVTIMILCDGSINSDKYEKVGISIQNWYHGQNKRIKKEIDQTGSLLHEELLKFVGEYDVDIARTTTGPPF